MENLANQLRSVKLKKVSGTTRDYSDPKTAGFMTQDEIDKYQSSVLDANLEEWLDLLAEYTFPSKLLTMTKDEAQLFVSIYKRLFSNLDANAISKVNWRETVSSTESEQLSTINENLQNAMNFFLQNESDSVFVKLSSRSPKDAPMAQERFKSMYTQAIMKEDKAFQGSENVQIMCILKAGFEALRVSMADEVMDMCIRSERVYQDLLLALAKPDRFKENWVIRKFVNIDIDMEFRGFVYNKRLTALSQYNYLIYSQRLVEKKQYYLQLIETFFNENIMPKMNEFLPNYIIDFAVCENGNKVWVIEINPFMVTTDAALFSWEHEMLLLQGLEQQAVAFRVTEKPRPGAKAMLPSGMRDLIAECSNEIK